MPLCTDHIVAYKPWDKTTAPGKEFYGPKAGDPIAEIRLDDPVWGGKSVDEIISEEARKIYTFVRYPVKAAPYIREMLQPIGNPEDKENRNFYRPRKYRLDPAKLCQATGDADVWVKSQEGDTAVPILDCTGVSIETLHRDASLLGNDIVILDLRSVSAGNYNVGPGEIYTLLSLAYADIANLTAALTFIITGAFTESSVCLISENLNGYEFCTTSDVNPYLDATAGHLISVNLTGAFLSMQMEGPGTVKIEKQNHKWISAYNSANTHINAAAIGTALTKGIIRDCIIDGDSKCRFGFRCSDPDWNGEMYNVIFNAMDQAVFNQFGTNLYGGVAAINSGSYGFNVGGLAARFTGCVSNGSGIADWLNNSGAVGDTNWTGDSSGEDGDFSSGSGNLTGRTFLTDYESGTIGDGSTFVLPKASGGAYGVAVNPYITDRTYYGNDDILIVPGDVDLGPKGLARGGARFRGIRTGGGLTLNANTLRWGGVR